MAQRAISDAGISLIQAFEGCPDGDPSTVNLDPYLDPVDIWTIGWGHVLTSNGRRLEGERDRGAANAVFPGGITVTEASAILRADLFKTCREVGDLLKVPVNDNEFAALVSFAFNVGSRNLRNSTLLRELNGGNRAAAADQFGRWVLAQGVRLAGLIRRRQAERALFIQS